jgi:uncharacterized protein (DUF983 family)
MATLKDVMCPKCRESRLLEVVSDARGDVIFCKVCSHDFSFAEGSELSRPNRMTMRVRDLRIPSERPRR